MIKLLPGSNLQTKTTSFLAAASVATYLISKEIYVLDLETIEMFCLFGAYYIWYNGAKPGALDFFKQKKEDIRKVLEKAREDHAAVVRERIEHVTKLADAVPVTNALYDISKDIATLEKQVYEMKQKVAFTQSVKTQLDAWERYELNQRDQQQKMVAQKVKQRIEELVKDPKVQEKVLSQTLKDIDSIKA